MGLSQQTFVAARGMQANCGLVRLFACVVFLLAGMATAQSASQPGPQAAVPAFSAMAPGPVGPGWRVAGLPRQTEPITEFAIVAMDGRRVLRLQADASYGNLVFDTRHTRLGPNPVLRWSWQLERGLPASDLTSKQGDDAPVKVCALFDMPLDRLSLTEATRLRLARAISGESLPSATLCYIWDRRLPEGAALANAFSPRVRYLVASSGEPRVGQWITHRRNLAADFLRAFGHEASTVPPLVALLVGADSDNTRGHSLAYVGDLTLAP